MERATKQRDETVSNPFDRLIRPLPSRRDETRDINLKPLFAGPNGHVAER